MVIDKSQSAQAKITKAPHFIQLIGTVGSGCRRLALDFIRPARKAVWVSMKWNLYAPVLWKLAEDRGIHLLGVEYLEKKKLRSLCKTLLESQIFDAWILDDLKLSQAEGMFLQKLLRPFQHPSHILVLGNTPHSFCQERIHIHLSHQNYRLTWSKGGSPTPRFLPSPLMDETAEYQETF